MREMLDVVPPGGQVYQSMSILVAKTKHVIVCALLSDMFVPSSVCGFCLVRFVVFYAFSCFTSCNILCFAP